jgi:hypothetical protein
MYEEIMQKSQASSKSSIDWDLEKLREFGVPNEFISTLSSRQARDLVKGLLYLSERSLSQ